MALKSPQLVASVLKKILLTVLVLFANPAFSLSVSGIYNAQVVVEDQSASQVLKAKKLGLSQVLVKVTGQTQSLNSALIRKALNDVESYVQQFSFTTQLNAGQPKAAIELAFDTLKVNQLVSDAGLPIWGTERAAVLVWLVEDAQGGRQIINSDSHPVAAQIMSQANERGIPMLWPLLDIEDQLAIDAGALWGLFKEPIKEASKRYQADGVLVGRIFQDTQGLWQAQWDFWLDDIEQQWSSQSADLAALTAPLQDHLASSLVAKFALATSVKNPDEAQLESVILRVDRVINFEDYVELKKILQALSGIQQVQLYSANGATLEFKLFAQSSLAKIKSIVDLKQRLKLVDNSEQEQFLAQPGSSNDLIWHYQWR
ncbi:DUF2066 domain-containing protein [Oceanospirillaceae bacterium]|nr:DUF2066 domain-containing protein [Oceanospirillaceae bacterium]